MLTVLFAARSAMALHRLLDVLPVFAGDERVSRVFTLVPGSDFGLDALADIERAHARTVPWDEACRTTYDLIVTASPKGPLHLLRGPRVLLPHGAGFSKSVQGEGSRGTASGLDPDFLLRGGTATTALHALAHPSQVARLAALSPRAAARAAVVGDPTLDRILTSLPRRDAYRGALGSGARKLIVLSSTWGPESLLERRPSLPAELAAGLPQDAYQLALLVHPNQRSRTGDFDLAEQLAPALDAGMVLAGPYEHWAAVLVAGDALITDHGSTALYFAAAKDRPILSAYDGGKSNGNVGSGSGSGGELIPDSPMAQLLSRVPRLDHGAAVEEQLARYRPGTGRTAATSAFTGQGQVLERLRREFYRLLDLAPPVAPVAPRPLPPPAPAARVPVAFAVRVQVGGAQTMVERFSARTDLAAHHLAAEHGAAGERHLQSAGLLYRRTGGGPPASPYSAVWTVAGWVAHVLDAYPGCGTAAVILSPENCLVQARHGTLTSVRIDAARQDGRVVRTDPAAVLSAVHAQLRTRPGRGAPGAGLAMSTCVIGGLPYRVRLSPATPEDAARTV
ncbi:translation initiation factor 2 [Streptomyces sp. NBC_01508]|uniref:translation initiation factor 2 n=1 Tax=Streptomyces sp. NBC_01508 TaxID=2903888 RepID=UPI00386756AF